MYAGKMPDGGWLPYETLHLLAGEASGETDYVSLPNLLAGRELVKELLQEECEPQALSQALLPLLAKGKTSHAMHDTFRELHQQIRCNADEQAADAVPELAQ